MRAVLRRAGLGAAVAHPDLDRPGCRCPSGGRERPRQVPTAHQVLDASARRTAAAPYDPLRLCVYATIALIACLLGPVALLGFAVLAIAGYARARRAGLLRSRCKLGDTRLVLPT